MLMKHRREKLSYEDKTVHREQRLWIYREVG